MSAPGKIKYPARTPAELARLRSAYLDGTLSIVGLCKRFSMRQGELYTIIERERWPNRGRASKTHAVAKLAGRKVKPKTAKQIIEERRAEDAAREQALYGDLAADVLLLRKVGFVVTREADGYRVGNTNCTAAEVRAKAARERRLQKPLAPLKPVVIGRVYDSSTQCPCGRPASHRGRCWHRRGFAGPTEKSKSSGSTEARRAETGNKPGCDPGEGGVPTATGIARSDVRGAAIQPCAGVAPGPLEPILARLDAIEAQMSEFMRLLALAVGARRQSLEHQVAGLAEIEAELRRGVAG